MYVWMLVALLITGPKPTDIIQAKNLDDGSYIVATFDSHAECAKHEDSPDPHIVYMCEEGTTE